MVLWNSPITDYLLFYRKTDPEDTEWTTYVDERIPGDQDSFVLKGNRGLPKPIKPNLSYKLKKIMEIVNFYRLCHGNLDWPSLVLLFSQFFVL